MESFAQVHEILPAVTGTTANGEWKRQVVIFNYTDSDRKFLVTFMSERGLADVAQLHIGDYVKVGFELTARLYEDKWFSDVKGYFVRKLQETQQTLPLQPLEPPQEAPEGYSTDKDLTY